MWGFICLFLSDDWQYEATGGGRLAQYYSMLSNIEKLLYSRVLNLNVF